MSVSLPRNEDPTDETREGALLLERADNWRPEFSRAKPIWLVPVIFLYNLSRGMVTAPKVEVFTRIACQQVLPEVFSSFWNPNSSTPPECLSDPGVQKATAHLQAKVNTLFAVLCTFTAGRWGRYGDEHGRRTVLAFTTVGALCTDFLFLLATRSHSPSYGSAFLLVTPFFEGTLGGLATYFASTHAYVSDCTRPGSRSTTFAFLQGIMYVGLALGPEIAGGVFHFVPSSDVSTIFILNLASFVLNLMFILFLLPESVPRERLQAKTNRGAGISLEPNRLPQRSCGTLFSTVKEGVVKFFLPLSLFLPSRNPVSGALNWNLTIFALALIMYELSMGLYSVKPLYAKHMFGWNAEQLGYYVSYIWVVRAVYLLALLPTIVRFIKSRRPSTHIHSARNELRFDITLAAAQFSADVLANTLVLIGPSFSAPTFVVFMTIAVFASGAMPVMNSVGASLLHSLGQSSASGQLFGAMSVIASITHAIQPFMFSSLYGDTVATFPEAIFLLAAGLVAGCIAFLYLLRVRTRSLANTPDEPSEAQPTGPLEETESI